MRNKKFKKITSIILILCLFISILDIRVYANQSDESKSAISISSEELETKIEYAEALIKLVKYDGNLQNAINQAKEELSYNDIQESVLSKLVNEINRVSNGKSNEFLDQLVDVDEKLQEINYMDSNMYSEESWSTLDGYIWTVKYNLSNFFSSMSLYQVERYNRELIYYVDRLEVTFYKVNSNNTVTRIVDVFEPTTLADGYYQVHRGDGWIKTENDLITSGIIDGEGSGNLIKLSKATSKNVTHGLEVNAAVSAEIREKASIGIESGFGWQPEQSFTTLTASTLISAREDSALYVKLYTMNEKVETYKIQNGKIVERLESYNPIGTVGIYGEEDSAYAINILDYHISEPTQVKMFKAESNVRNISDTVEPQSDAEYEILNSSKNNENLTPMIHHKEVIEKRDNTKYDAIEEDYRKVSSESAPMSDESSERSSSNYTDLEDGMYTRFLGSGWIKGGDGHVATITAMPGSVGRLSRTIQETFKIVHSVGIQAGIDAEIADSKVQATIGAEYTNDVEEDKYLTVEVRAAATDGKLKHIDAYENNFKYEVITVKDNKIVEESQAYVSDGIYAKITEEDAPVILEDAEDKQVFNSLVDHEFTPSISENTDIYVVGALGREFNKIFNAKASDYTAEDAVNVHFQVKESGLYRIRTARVFGPRYTPNFEGYATALREPEYYAEPEYMKVFNINSLLGRVNYQEYYEKDTLMVPTYGGAYYNIYLEEGEDYVVEIGPSSMTESFIPPGGYVPGYGQEVDPEDMYGNIFEIERTLPYFSNAGYSVALDSALDIYNQYEEEDYLKESFIEFEKQRNYGNKLIGRGLYAIPESLIKTLENLESAAEKLIHIDDYKPVEPEIELNPDEYFVKVNPDNETIEKVTANNLSELSNGHYVIDRGYGWIRSEAEDLVNTAVVDAETEKGMVNVSKTLSVSTTHQHELSASASVKFSKIFKIGVTLGFDQSYSDTKIIESDHILEVPEGNKGYLKVYTVNHKYETIQVENGRIVYRAISYDPIGTIGMTAIVEDGTINENNFILQDNINIFADENGGIVKPGPTEPTEPPTEPVDPTSPTGPTVQPTSPTGPTDPEVQPTDPTGPQISPGIDMGPTSFSMDQPTTDTSEIESIDFGKVEVSAEDLEVTEMSFDDVILSKSQSAMSANIPSNILVGSTYRVNKTIAQLNAGEKPSTTLIEKPTLDVNGVYIQYLGDGHIDGEKSFINTVTADPNIRASLETSTETKSYTAGGVNIENKLEIAMFELVVENTYRFKQENGIKIGVGAITYDRDNESQLKVYDMYKKYRVYEVKNNQIINEQFLSTNSGIYAKTFVPGDYTSALSEETSRNTLATSQKGFSDASKNSYNGGADSILSVRLLNDGSVERISRIGYTVDTNISTLPNGYYLIDLGDNWIQSDVKSLIGSNTNYNRTSTNSTTMNAIIEEEVSTQEERSGEGTLGLSKKYENVSKSKQFDTTVSILVGGGESIEEGSKSTVQLNIPAKSNGLLKLYESSRRTDLVEIRDGEIVDRYIKYLPNGIIATSLIGNSSVGLKQENAYIAEPTKATVSELGAQNMVIHNSKYEYTPYLPLKDAQITITHILADEELSKYMYDSATNKLIDGNYTIYAGDWYSGNLLGTHYVTAGMSGELKQSVTAQTTWSFTSGLNLAGLRDRISASMKGTYNRVLTDTNIITSGTRATSPTSYNTLELYDKYQKFIYLEVNGGKISGQAIVDVLVGTEGILKD